MSTATQTSPSPAVVQPDGDAVLGCRNRLTVSCPWGGTLPFASRMRRPANGEAAQPMVYKATQDTVRRVMPLLDLLATRTVDKARLLQYLSARSGVDWGVLELLWEDQPATPEDDLAERSVTFRDLASGAEHRIRYPACLPQEIEPLVLEEYKRLAGGRPLTVMALPLFSHFFGATHCAHCRWRGEGYEQFHRECHFANRPINFEPDQSTAL